MQLALSNDNTEQLFRDLYYHLYSNSTVSRSERILSDLSKLILISIGYAKRSILLEVSLFTAGTASANLILLPALARLYPTSITLDDRFTLDDSALRHAFSLLQKIDLVSSPSHTFGDAFQALMGPRLRGDKGQFFTPRSVVRSMVDILAPEAGSRVIDPACGTGGFLSAVLDNWKRNGSSGTVIGIDKDHDLSLLASALSTIHDQSGDVRVHNANSLSFDQISAKNVSLESFDYVLTNPPFGAKIGVTDKATLEQFALGHVWDHTADGWQQASVVRASQDPQVLFIELCIRLLKKGGRMAIVLPEGIFGNAGAGYIWDYIRANGQIEGLIDCPRTTFQPGTDTKTNILLFKRTPVQQKNNNCWVAVAYTCGHDKRGRSVKLDGRLVQDDFAVIANDWRAADKYRKVWNLATLKDPYYLVPRYYDQRLSEDVERDAEQLSAGVVSLGELVDLKLLSIRKGHEVGSDAYGTGDIPFVRTSDIHNFEVSYDPTNCVSEEFFLQYANQQKLKSGDILMVVDGRYKIGRCAILHEWSVRCIIQSHLRIISISAKAKFSPMALLYSLSLPSVQREIRRLVFIQSTLGGLGRRINEIRIPDPRASSLWGDTLSRFQEAVAERARHSAYLQGFGYEVEL
ncbi:N-6 DNA methylase [Methyloferula stellata]|uniref:N-6 DNA methylase n=1 Tax=Methyloferula stellata TaxID=876270 RepID=UPI000A049308|nr:N-6 DNA methylase [Methyloferula stellata]